MLPTKLMSSELLAVLLVVLYCHQGLGDGASHNEKCEVGLTSDHKTLDTCDQEKNLVCQHGRCVCQDQANQIWSARLVKVSSRTKRGSKKGKIGAGKAILAGAAAGAAGGYIGGKIAQAGSSGGGGGSSGFKRKEHYQTYYSCHSRVGGQCLLDAYKNVIININNKPAEAASVTTPTSTTTAHPTGSNSSIETTTSTTAAPAPVAAAQTSQVSYDFSSMTIPKCVEYAECKTSQVKIVNGTVVSQVSSDPRLGACTCREGYKANSLDTCVKANGVGEQAQISFFLISIAVLISFYSK